MELTGKNVLVTGASRGIGRAVAAAFATAGARLALHYHQDLESARRTEAELPGGPHLLVQADLASAQQVEHLVTSALEELERIHVLVNNAGIYQMHPPLTTDAAAWQQAWERTLGINLLGPAHLCHLLGRHMVERGGGRIVNISSRGAFRGEPEAPAYGASKAGLNALSQSLALALAPHGVYVYVVAPGWVKTDMAHPHLEGPQGDELRAQSPLGRAARPEEIARLVTFLASPGSEYLTGAIVDANGASYLRS
jgi:3-oxoacyl-[acyl-carrier protein] reductase